MSGLTRLTGKGQGRNEAKGKNRSKRKRTLFSEKTIEVRDRHERTRASTFEQSWFGQRWRLFSQTQTPSFLFCLGAGPSSAQAFSLLPTLLRTPLGVFGDQELPGIKLGAPACVLTLGAIFSQSKVLEDSRSMHLSTSVGLMQCQIE